jgi:hypothetical protein
MDIDREMETALALDGVKLEQLTGQDHGPWGSFEPDYDGMWAEIESLDDAAREAIERANGGPVPYESSLPALKEEWRTRDALMRVIGKITLGEADPPAFDVVRTTNLRQSATETPADLVKRITLALLKEMAGVE